MIDIKAIKAAAEAATKGEWSWQEGTPLVTKLWNGAEHSIAAVDWRTLAWHEDGNCAGRESGANAKHIATANPAAVIALLDRLEAAEKALDEPAQTTCNCRWEGGAQVQWCALHQSHEDAIHEWAERAKTAEKKLVEPAVEPVGYVRMLNGEPTPDDDGCVFSYGESPYRDTYGNKTRLLLALPSTWKNTASQERRMKLPEPIGWSYLFEDDGSLCQQFDTREEADRWVDSPDCLWSGYVSPLYSEAQVKELLAQANASRIAAQTENETLKGKLAKFGLDARRKYEPVLKMALEALHMGNGVPHWPSIEHVKDSIRKVLE